MEALEKWRRYNWKTQLQHQLQGSDKERATIEVGDFDPASVMRLQEVGYQGEFLYLLREEL